MKKSNLTVAFYLILVFVSGILVGAFGQKLYLARTVNASVNPRPDEWRKHYLDDMRRRVKIDDQQAAQINAIFDQIRERVRAVRERMQPEMDALHRDQVDQIRSVLNDSQKGEYAKMIEERERERERQQKKK